MLDSELEPKEIYKRREEFGLAQALDMLADILDNSKDKDLRKQSIKYIGLLGSKSKPLKKECFGTLENLVISDENLVIRCQAAKALGELKYEKGLKPLKWLLEEKELDSRVKLAALRAIANIRMEEEEIKLFIDQLECPTKSISACAKNKLTLLSPDKLIRNLVESLTNKNYSEAHKVEIIKLINFDISSISISFEGESFLKVTYPDVIRDLISYKSDICKVITSNLRDDDRAFYESALNILNIIGEEVNQELIELLDHDDFIVKQNSIRLMGKLKINDKEGIEKLIENLDDMYSEVSKASIEALGEIGDLTTVPELLKALDIEDVEYEYLDIDMKWYIIEAIKSIYLDNKNATFEYLYEGLNSYNDVIKESVAFIFGELGKEEFVDTLIDLLEERNLDVRKNAIIALGKIGNKRSIDKLLGLLDQEYVYWLLKKVSIDALYNIYYRNFKVAMEKEPGESREFVINREKLVEFINSHNNECFKVKLSVIKFLEVFGDQSSLDALLRLVNDFHRLVRISAEKAIKRIEKRLETEEEETS